LPKFGWVLEYLLEEEEASVSVLTEGSGLEKWRVELLIDLISMNDWFTTYRSPDDDLYIRLNDDSSMKKIQEDYLTGVLNRIYRSEKLFRQQEVRGRVWLQFYSSQDVLVDRKSSGSYYRVRLPDRMLAIAGLEKGDQVQVEAASDALDGSNAVYLKITKTASTPSSRRKIYEIFDESPSNLDPKLTIPAEYREEFIKSDNVEFNVEVWEPAKVDTHLRLYQQESTPTGSKRQNLLLENGYWAINTAEPLPTMFYSKIRG